MPKLRVLCVSMSLDGFSAGPEQSLEHPLGRGGPEIMEWFAHTDTWRRMQGQCPGETGVDDRMAAASFEGIGAWILGRNMFGPDRGPWPNEDWRGWWGEEPPYHTPAFVLTHHARPSLTMQGGTVFHFVTGGIAEAWARAREAAGDRDVRVGGGPSTIRQYLAARLIDDLHLAVPKVFLGRGEPLLAGLDLRSLGYVCTDQVAGERAMHLLIRRRD